MTVQTTLLQEDSQGAVYRTRVQAPARRLLGRALGRPLDYTFTFSVTPEGALGFDNRQAQARGCAKGRVARSLAEEMTAAARARYPQALSGRTRRGMGLELSAHYRAYRLGLMKTHTVTTELGSLTPAAPDFDDNAAWFERPLRSLPQILRRLLART